MFTILCRVLWADLSRAWNRMPLSVLFFPAAQSQAAQRSAVCRSSVIWNKGLVGPGRILFTVETPDLNILIRTIVLQGKNASFSAGGGIVSDSDPVAELEETEAKARGMLRALS